MPNDGYGSDWQDVGRAYFFFVTFASVLCSLGHKSLQITMAFARTHSFFKLLSSKTTWPYVGAFTMAKRLPLWLRSNVDASFAL